MKVSIAGTGRIAWSLELDKLRYKPCTHIGALCALAQKNKKIEWAGLCDTNHEKSQGAYEYIQSQTLKPINPQITTDYREIIQKNPDLFVIAADTDIHFKMLEAAIKQGIPRIVVEKPIVLTVKEANKLEKIASGKKSRIWVNYERRYHPKYEQVRSWIHENQIYGKALYYHGWLSTNLKNLHRHKEGEGVLLHDTTHLLDLAFFLFGPGKTRQISSRQRKESHLLEITHQNSGPSPLFGEILTTICTPAFHIEIEIIFEKARIRCGNGFLHIEKVKQSPYYEGFQSLEKPQIIPDKKMVFKDNPFIRLYSNVFNGSPPENMTHEACANIVALSKKNEYNNTL